MGVPKLRLKISVADYLESEKVSDVRHEYLDGEVYAMAGTSLSHNEIIGNIYEKLRGHLRGGKYRPYFVDIKVYVEKFNRFYYPDLLIICGENKESNYYTTKPTLIIEVLSPSTALTDSGKRCLSIRKSKALSNTF